MAPDARRSGYGLLAFMPAIWLAMITLAMNAVHKPPDDHIPNEGQGSSLHEYMVGGTGVIPQQPSHLERSLFVPDSDNVTTSVVEQGVETKALDRMVRPLDRVSELSPKVRPRPHKTSEAMTLFGAVETPSSTKERDTTSTTMPPSHYGPSGGLLAESLWVWNHCKRGSVVRGRPIQLMLFVLGCWWRGLGNLMSILSDPAAFLCAASPHGLANAFAFVVASLAAASEIYAYFVLSTLMFGLVVVVATPCICTWVLRVAIACMFRLLWSASVLGLVVGVSGACLCWKLTWVTIACTVSVACLCWKLTWVTIACTWAVILLLQRSILAVCIRAIVRFSDTFSISWHMESAMWRTAFRLLRPGVLAAGFHLLTSPSTPSAAMTCFAILLLNFDELGSMPRTWSLLMYMT